MLSLPVLLPVPVLHLRVTPVQPLVHVPVPAIVVQRE